MKHGRSDYDRRIIDRDVPSKKAIEESVSNGDDLPSHIGADEPVFLFRAKDKGSVSAVQGYIKYLRGNNGDPQVIRSAEQQAKAMQQWQEDNPKAVQGSTI